MAPDCLRGREAVGEMIHYFWDRFHASVKCCDQKVSQCPSPRPPHDLSQGVILFSFIHLVQSKRRRFVCCYESFQLVVAVVVALLWWW